MERLVRKVALLVRVGLMVIQLSTAPACIPLGVAVTLGADGDPVEQIVLTASSDLGERGEFDRLGWVVQNRPQASTFQSPGRR
jgi:hypothetical protein